MNAWQYCIGLLVLAGTVTSAGTQERQSPKAEAQGEAGVVMVKQATLVDAIDGWKASAGKKLLWVKIEVTKMSPSLKSIKIENIRALASDKSQLALFGYYLGDSSLPRIEMYGLSPGQVYLSMDSKDGSSTYSASPGTKTIEINKVPAVLSLTFEVLPKSTIVELLGFGTKSIPIESASSK